MDRILDEVGLALDAGLYHLAIALALTLPDICACLESPKGNTKGRSERAYKDWYTAHLAQRFPRLTELDAYSLRCGVVHQGRYGHPNMQYDRVLFTLPNHNDVVMHDILMSGTGGLPGTVLSLDAVRFCREIVDAARKWFLANENNPTVQANLPNIVRYRPEGLEPYIVGLPVIA